MCSLPGLQDSNQTGDDRTSHCCTRSYGTTGMTVAILSKSGSLSRNTASAKKYKIIIIKKSAITFDMCSFWGELKKMHLLNCLSDLHHGKCSKLPRLFS